MRGKAVPQQPIALYEIASSYSDQVEAEREKLDQRLAECSRVVRGSEPKIERIMAELQSFDRFKNRLKRLCKTRGFAYLPGVADESGRIIPGVHKLVIKPWEGYFHVSNDGRSVTALTFSRGSSADNVARLAGLIAGKDTKP